MYLQGTLITGRKELTPLNRTHSTIFCILQAAADDRDEALRLLLCHDLNIDAVNNDGNTPLHIASKCGMMKATRAIADGFPNENIMNHRGFTALDEAIAAGRNQCKTCIQDFSNRGKLDAMKVHFEAERDRLARLRRKQVEVRKTMAAITGSRFCCFATMCCR